MSSDLANTPCLECGAPTGRKFCEPACKARWNNRRKKRGEVVYDLMMSLRYNRDQANEDQVMTYVSRFLADCKREDDAEREGRQSWRRHQDVLRERPQLKADIGWTNAGRAPL